VSCIYFSTTHRLALAVVTRNIVLLSNINNIIFLLFHLLGADSKSEGPGKAADNIPKVPFMCLFG